MAKKPKNPKLNKNHKLAQGLIGYELFNEGKISNVKVFDRALAQEQIEREYNGNYLGANNNAYKHC